MAKELEFATKEEAWRAGSEIVSSLKSSHHEMRSLFRDLTFSEEDDFIDEFIEKVERRLGKKIVGGVRTFIEKEIREHYE